MFDFARFWDSEALSKAIYHVASNDRSCLSLFVFVFGCTWDPLPDVQKFVYRRLLEIERLNLVDRQRL